MLDFQPCTPQSCTPLQNIGPLISPRGCDTSIINLCSWEHLYHGSIATHKGNIVLRFFDGNRHSYSLRFQPEQLVELLEVVSRDAETLGEKMRIFGVNEDILHYYLEADPTLQATYSDNYSDYVYDRQSLASLAGHKLQSKRNFLNRFRRLYPQYEYHPLGKKDIDACLALDKSWINKGLQLGHTDEEISERKTIKYVFDHWQELGAIGGTIYVEGNLVAFTYGAAINNDTFDVCVEKADTSYEGAYATINNEFVNHLPQQYQWINREEDLGIDGLRQAKTTYQPVLKLRKYVIEKS
ncbi:MAG: DUF2156 domain-containing protein [Bacteroidaceae bacterium]|nr:DUF2156 domain-containing protein [Bacteroidaceae bacterium]